MIKVLKLTIQIIKLITLILKIKFTSKKNGLEKYIKIYIEEMGPVFIKFAQIISVRTDIFSKNIIKELEKLQTHAKNIHFSDIKKNIRELDKMLDKNIKKINENPIASASIAQIHTGILNNKKKIIIKVLKPHIKDAINRDINILYTISKMLIFFFRKLERLKLIDIIDELKKTLENETDFKKEILNMIKIKENIKELKNIYIPNIVLTSNQTDMLITEYIDGINITNKEKLKKQNLDTITLIQLVLNLFYKQVFEHEIFHADLHPGNILISKTKSIKPIIVLLDFGIIGKLKQDEKIYLRENILAFAKKDYKKIIHLHIKAGTIKIKENANMAEKVLYNAFSTISDKKLEDIDFKNTINSLMELSKILNLQLQPNLILFQKTLLTIEGICRHLNTQANLWQITRNEMEKILINNFFKIKIKDNMKKNIYKHAKKTNTHTYQKIFSDNKLLLSITYIVSLIILNIIIKYYTVIIFFI